MNRTFALILIIIITLSGLGAWAFVSSYSNNSLEEEPSSQISIVATLYPTFDLTRIIAGNTADVSLLVDPGVEPHSFEPTPSDILAINNANIFIYNGERMEPWVADILSGISPSVTVLDISQGVSLQEVSMEEDRDQAHKDDHSSEVEDSHAHEGIDPHFWLDFNNTKIMAQTIKRALETISPQSEQMYQERLSQLQNELITLDLSYQEGLTTCSSRILVHAGHYAFGYLTNRYNIEYKAAQSISPNSEPSASDIAELINIIRAESSQAVFTENLIEPRVAEVISDETGVPTLVLHPGHTISADEFESGISFISLMRQNLTALQRGLGCE